MTRTGRIGLLIVAWIATRSVLLLFVFKVFTLPGPDVTSDISGIYQGWAQVLSSGSFPTDDVAWQYPPAAALAVLSPALLPFLEYSAAFFVLAALTDAATFVLLVAAGVGRTRTTAGTDSAAGTHSTAGDRRLAGAWVWLAGVPLLGPTAYARYDLMVTAVAVAALLAAARRPGSAGALAAFGALLKVWPALLLIGSPRGRPTRTAWGSAAATGALLSLLAAVSLPGAFAFLAFQRDRGIEVESLGSLVFHVARQYGWEGQVLLNYGSVEFLGPHVGAVGTASLGLTLLSFGWLLWWRFRAVAWTPGTPHEAAFAAVLLFVVTSRVISPQYLVWLVGLAAVCMTLRACRQGLPSVLVLIASGVTVLEFPVRFADVVTSSPLGITLLAVRNGLLVAAALFSCARLWRSTVTEPRRRAAEAAPVPTGSRQRAEERDNGLVTW